MRRGHSTETEQHRAFEEQGCGGAETHCQWHFSQVVGVAAMAGSVARGSLVAMARSAVSALTRRRESNVSRWRSFTRLRGESRQCWVQHAVLRLRQVGRRKDWQDNGLRVPRGPRLREAGGRGRAKHRRRACWEVIRRCATGLHGHGEAHGKEAREGADSEVDMGREHGPAKGRRGPARVSAGAAAPDPLLPRPQTLSLGHVRDCARADSQR
jgi:hypothetical protein